jgi:deoxycytidylate deaminase
MFPIELIRHESPELFIALVAPVGADVDKVCEFLKESLLRFEYKLEPIRVIEQLKKFDGYLQKEPTNEYEKIKGRMDAGDRFRERVKRNDALALLALSQISEFRKEANERGEPVKRQAYLFRSLKRPEEIKALRRIYGSNLIVISVHSGREQRVLNLAQRIANSEYSAQSSNYRDLAEKLVLRDEADESNIYGQKLRQAFGHGDVFVDAGSPNGLRYHLDRFTDLLFGRPVITPTKDELGMAHAFLAGMRSAELGRQVGAAICDRDGRLIATGTNEVPKAHGGHYWDGDSPDGRDWARGYDSSDRFKKSSLGELLKTFLDNDLLSKEVSELPIPTLLEKVQPLMKQTRYMQLIEFVRAVHAEMSAITDAASRGVPVCGGTLYVTTFPCHECARHIVAAGIRRVVYIEPYAKSLAIELHGDSIELDPSHESEKIPFVPFLGVAPKNYNNMFGMPGRKDSEGNLLSWNALSANPRVSGSFWSYLKYEIEDLDFLATDLEKSASKPS